MSEPIPDCAETEIPVLERLRRENTALAERLKACEEDHKVCISERDEALGSLDYIEKQCEGVSVSKVIEQRDQLTADLARVTAERDTLKADLARVTADKAERERDILRTENARLRW